MKGDFRESVEAETVLREKLKAAEAALDEERRGHAEELDDLHQKWLIAEHAFDTMSERLAEEQERHGETMQRADRFLAARDEMRAFRDQTAAALTAEQQAHRSLRSWADGAEVDLDALQAELAAEQQAHERTLAELEEIRNRARENGGPGA
jgi:hypothetical protein